MAKCSVCGKDVGMSYEMIEGRKYCDECYRAAVLQGESIASDRTNRERKEAEVPMIAQIFSAFAWIEWILGGISAFYLGSRFGAATTIASLVVVFIAGCIPMGFSTIIRLLAEIAWNTKKPKS